MTFSRCYECDQICRTDVRRVDTDGDGRPIYEDRSRCCNAEVWQDDLRDGEGEE